MKVAEQYKDSPYKFTQVYEIAERYLNDLGKDVYRSQANKLEKLLAESPFLKFGQGEVYDFQGLSPAEVRAWTLRAVEAKVKQGGNEDDANQRINQEDLYEQLFIFSKDQPNLWPFEVKGNGSLKIFQNGHLESFLQDEMSDGTVKTIFQQKGQIKWDIKKSNENSVRLLQLTRNSYGTMIMEHEVGSGSDGVGKQSGRGIIIRPNGVREEGWMEDFLFEGYGRTIKTNGYVYEGGFRRHNPEGEGELSYASGESYKGTLKDGNMEGYGVHTTAGGEVYKGQFRKNLRHGKGEVTWPSKGSYQGDFYEGAMQGVGKVMMANGNVYEGDLFANKP